MRPGEKSRGIGYSRVNQGNAPPPKLRNLTDSVLLTILAANYRVDQDRRIADPRRALRRERVDDGKQWLGDVLGKHRLGLTRDRKGMYTLPTGGIDREMIESRFNADGFDWAPFEEPDAVGNRDDEEAGDNDLDHQNNH